MDRAESAFRASKKNDDDDEQIEIEGDLIDQVLSGCAALIKETGWKPDEVIWDISCAHLFLLTSYWPTYKSEKEKPLDFSGKDALKLLELGGKYEKR